MRSIGVFFAASFFSLLAFSATYSGTGKWKSSKGEQGSYSVVANVSMTSDSLMSISETLDLGAGSTLSVSVNLQKIDDTWYNVVDDAGNKIGSGYCWTCESTQNKICHSYLRRDNYVVETTIKKSGDDIYRIGSKTMVDSGEKIIWQDKLEEQDAEQADDLDDLYDLDDLDDLEDDLDDLDEELDD